MYKFIFVWLLLVICSTLHAQLPVHFYNPSFEGVPLPSSRLIKDWTDCGSLEFYQESPPDLQPGSFGVTLFPLDGNSYLGMVTRSNGTYESVGQYLVAPLLKDSLYQFNIYLAKSEDYVSASPNQKPNTKEFSKKNVELINSNKNTILRVWGGPYECYKDELLYQSQEIGHEEWAEYVIEFVPKSSGIKFISLEAYFPDDFNFTRGNLMIDNITTVEEPE